MDLATVHGIEHGRNVRLAVDAMGGDHGPVEVVAGALLYAAEHPETSSSSSVTRSGSAPTPGRSCRPNVAIEPASQVIEMHEHPALALREKKDSSILVACDLVKRGSADAVVTAGHTGAGMAAAVLRLGRTRGVDRPALAIQMVTETGPFVLLDIGANPDSTAENLAQYAHMGSLFAERALGVPNPRVALLSIGEEKGKGDARIQRASELLDASGLNYTGNVEGKDLVHHAADVVVCDAVVGNVTIKFFEGLATFIFDALGEGVSGRHPRSDCLPADAPRHRPDPANLRLRGARWLTAARSPWHGDHHARPGPAADDQACDRSRCGRGEGPRSRADRRRASPEPRGGCRARGLRHAGRPRGAGVTEAELAVSHAVIRDVVRLATMEVPGVHRVGWAGSPLRRLVVGRPVSVRVRSGVVTARVVIVARPGQPLAQLVADVRAAVAGAVERLLAMRLGEVTIRVDGVGG